MYNSSVNVDDHFDTVIKKKIPSRQNLFLMFSIVLKVIHFLANFMVRFFLFYALIRPISNQS